MKKIELSYEEVAFIMSVTSKYPLISDLRHVTMYLGSKFPLNEDVDVDPQKYKELKDAILE